MIAVVGDNFYFFFFGRFFAKIFLFRKFIVYIEVWEEMLSWRGSGSESRRAVSAMEGSSFAHIGTANRKQPSAVDSSTYAHTQSVSAFKAPMESSTGNDKRRKYNTEFVLQA